MRRVIFDRIEMNAYRVEFARQIAVGRDLMDLSVI